MQSKRKLAPVVGRDGINNSSSTREQDASTVELDTTFARVLGLSEGQRVRFRPKFQRQRIETNTS